MRILITGSAGRLGRILKKHLKNHDLTLLDKTEGEGTKRADVCSLEQLMPHFEGIETAIHLAADKRFYANWADLVGPNINGTRNVYEASRQSGVKRVIFASSLNVYPWERIFQQGKVIDQNTQTASENDYGLTKVIGERIGLDYHRSYKLSVINLRLGSTTEDDKVRLFTQGKTQPEDYAHWLSHRDFIDIINASLVFEGYACVPCTSANNPCLVDVNFIRKTIGILPQDSSEIFR